MSIACGTNSSSEDNDHQIDSMEELDRERERTESEHKQYLDEIYDYSNQQDDDDYEENNSSTFDNDSDDDSDDQSDDTDSDDDSDDTNDDHSDNNNESSEENAQADPDAIHDYWEQHTEDTEASGSPSEGETKILNDGAIQDVSPYNPGDVFQAETFNPDGSIHYTTIDSEENTRHSHDVTPDGDIEDSHQTDQNLPSEHPDRHK